MKVILLKDTPKVGQKNDIVEVKSGYAINFLIPNKLAVKATPEIEKEVLAKKESEGLAQEAKTQQLQKDLAELSKTPIKIGVKANEKGHLFAALGKEKIISAIKEQTGKEISENALDLSEDLKEVGEREVEAKAGDKKFTLKVEIEGN